MLLRTHIWVHCLRRLMCNPQHFRSPAASGFNRSALSLHITYLFDWVCLCLPAHYPNLSFNVEGGCEWLWHGGRCVETRSGTQRVTPALGGYPQPCRVTVSLRRKGKPSVNGRGNMSLMPHQQISVWLRNFSLSENELTFFCQPSRFLSSRLVEPCVLFNNNKKVFFFSFYGWPSGFHSRQKSAAFVIPVRSCLGGAAQRGVGLD